MSGRWCCDTILNIPLRPVMLSMFSKTGLFIVVFLCFFCGQGVHAQVSWPSPETEQMYTKAREYLSRGNFKQAIITFQQLIPLAPEQMVSYRDLAQAYYFSGLYPDAYKTLSSIIDNSKADEQSYQLAGASLAAMGENKKARTVLNKGVASYPHSGLLYHELGKMYEDKDEHEAALKSWLDGIEADPAYHVNYYDAAKIYAMTGKYVWTILYGEMFVNIEQHTARANETRKMVMSAYSQFFSTALKAGAPLYGKKSDNEIVGFEASVTHVLLSLAPVVADGITTENLVMLRTRFATVWQQEYASTYPFSLFARHISLLRSGYFDVYNQWLFGEAENAKQFAAWKNFHPNVMEQFESWIAQNTYKPVATDFYNDKKLKGMFQRKKN